MKFDDEINDKNKKTGRMDQTRRPSKLQVSVRSDNPVVVIVRIHAPTIAITSNSCLIEWMGSAFSCRQQRQWFRISLSF